MLNVAKLILSGMALTLASQIALAEPQFAVTRQGTEFLFDYIPDADSKITALGFRVDIGDLDPDSIDLSNCTAGIKPPHMGFCKANPGFVKVLVYSNDTDAILSASHIGSIKVSPQAARAPGSRNLGLRKEEVAVDRQSIVEGAGGSVLDRIKVRNLNYSDVNANDIKGEVLQ